MRNLIWKYMITILVFFLIIGCNKTENENPDEKMIPVLYYLSDEDKSLLDYYYDCKTITYADQDNNEIVFTTDSLYDITENPESNYKNGEVLSLRYNCLTEYFPNYSFPIWLTALDTSKVIVDIMFGTGTYWTDRHNDYVLSGFKLDPKCSTSIDTTFSDNLKLRFNYYDTLTLRSKQFYAVYHMWDESYNQDIHVTTDCYYTNEIGVIAFKNLDGKFWIRVTE